MNMYEQYARAEKRLILAVVLITAIILADQYTKWLVMETMLRVRESGGVAPAFLEWFFAQKHISLFESDRDIFHTLTLHPNLNFVMVWNQGISFGMFDTNAVLAPLLFMGLSILISVMLLIWFVLAEGRLISVALPLIIGGAIGNVIDRMRFAAVADFIDVHVGEQHWPAFNLADSCVVVGALLLAISMPGGGKKKS